MSPSRLRLVLPLNLFPLGFTAKILDASVMSPMHATCPAHLILNSFILVIVNGGQAFVLLTGLAQCSQGGDGHSLRPV